ncbi:MAG TPA: prephenate dehydratase [Candidatus Limnocylindrales bacterium]|nr:prephenate dehydratase [Candidatus Limnocylindrales bacterium]
MAGATEPTARPEPGPSVAFSGEPGAFAEDALLAALVAPRSIPVGGFREVFEAVRDGLADVGVVPIENVVNGTVREVYDLLLEHDLLIRGEVVVPVRLCLAALPGASLEGIERVYSHIQALGQADAFLRRRPWALLTTYNTAGAGRLIRERAETGSAAVLSPRAAAHFELAILADGIENDPANRTRFLLLGRPSDPFPADWRRPLEGPAAPRTTLAFAVRNEPGTLLAVLQVLANHRLNLSTLESRPSRRVAWEYVFWADIDADLLASDAAGALEAIRPLTTMVRVLGAYRRVTSA